MSLVGPRPLPLYEVENFSDPAQRRRLSVKPGLTCLWQIRVRNEVRDFETWVKLDLDYIDNWSILLDFWILVVILPVVLQGYGAKRTYNLCSAQDPPLPAEVSPSSYQAIKLDPVSNTVE
jgi:lipopolysaccharide/colanic/teichoic acid biosynthesis glycosyltransferase